MFSVKNSHSTFKKSAVHRNSKVIPSSANDIPTPANPHYFLFMLGTDTQYTHKPTQSEKKTPTPYDNGETLSYMARVVTHTLGETPKISDTKALSFSATSVAVVNGPTTLGSEVGQRIAQGVFLILKALEKGKSTIQISAHSRGGVESILIAHELERIKVALKESSEKTLFEIFSASTCSLTKTALAHFFKDIKDIKDLEQSIEVKKTWEERLSNAAINLFLMDPVPGGRYFGIPWLRWDDERFFKSLPCKEAELFIFRDERTCCFKPIVPAGITPILIPGHHGTASGNLYAQVITHTLPGELKEKETASVQHLMLGKLLTFINKTTHLFEGQQEVIDIDHPVLDTITNEYLNTKPEERSSLLLKLYQKVHQNDAIFKYFSSHTSYKGLGREESESKSRMVHYGAHNSIGLDAVIARLDGEFVNAEHALLHLHSLMDFSFDSEENAGLLVTKLGNVLNFLFSKFISKDDTKVKALFEKDADRKVTFQALSVFVDAISKKYLRNHLSKEDKAKLLQEMASTFKVLDDFKDKNDDKAEINSIIEDCESILRKGIVNTAEIHYKALIDQPQKLNTQLKCFLVSDDEFAQAFNKFLESVKNTKSEDSLITKFLSTILTQLQALDSLSIGKVRSILNKNIDLFIETGSDAQVEALLKDLAFSESSGIGSYLTADLLNKDKILKQLNLLYENITTFINATSHIRKLIGEEPLEIDEELLVESKRTVVRLASEIMAKKNIDLRFCPSFMGLEFFETAKNQAIALGATNPELEDLKEQLKEQKEASKIVHDIHRESQASKQLEIKALQSQLMQLEAYKASAAFEQENSKIMSASLNRDITTLQSQIDQLKQQLELLEKTTFEQRAKLEVYKVSDALKQQTIASLQEQISLLKQKIELNEQQFSDSIDDKNNTAVALQRTVVSLELKITDLKLEMNQMQQDFIEAKVKSEHDYKKQINQLKQQLEDLKKTTSEQSAEAKAVAQEKINILNTEKAQQQKLIDQLTTPKELTCGQFIEQQLKPTTILYMKHICKEAKKLNPSFDINNDEHLTIFSGTRNDLTKYRKTIEKLTAIQQLSLCLTDTKANVLPSNRIIRFTELLKTTNITLKEHRDLGWSSYFKNSMIIIGIVCSGIIPGIVALLAYSSYYDTSILSFTKSKGENYIDQVNKMNDSLLHQFKNNSKNHSPTFFAADSMKKAKTIEELLKNCKEKEVEEKEKDIFSMSVV